MERIDPEPYLTRIGWTEPVTTDLAGLDALMGAHLRTVPFENLDVHAGVPVGVGIDHSVPKIVDRRRGGWCFELNGAFGALLHALGFDVMVLGAAVLLDGPNDVLDHAALEVSVDGGTYLADVGFGVSFEHPLDLNRAGPQDGGGSGTYELLPSPKGTTLAHHVDGVPEAQYRFKRVAHDLADFAAASESMQADPHNHWHDARFATRLLGPDEADGADRVSLVGPRLRFRRAGEWTQGEVADDDWDAVLDRWFGLSTPGR